MACGRNWSMVGAMSRPSRKLLRYGVPVAVFAGGVAFLVAGWSAAFAWALVVVSLGWATQCANAAIAGPPSHRPCDDRPDGEEHRETAEHRHVADSRRPLSRARRPLLRAR
jgi:hypothetical protein